MSTPENTFIASVHKHLPAELYRIKNNNVYNAGQPDCWYSGNKADLWIEYKFIVRPKRQATLIKIDLSPLQENWIRSRYAEGRNVVVVVGSKEGGVWFGRDTWGIPCSAAEFAQRTVSRACLAEFITRIVSPCLTS